MSNCVNDMLSLINPLFNRKARDVVLKPKSHEEKENIFFTIAFICLDFKIIKFIIKIEQLIKLKKERFCMIFKNSHTLIICNVDRNC